MRLVDSRLVFAPSDLITFLESPFASWMERARIEGVADAERDPPRADMELLARKGDEHEQAWLASLRADGKRIWDGTPSKDRPGPTIDAMKAGHEILYQPYLEHDGFGGLADFLVRVPGPSRLGDFHYEIHDTKLAKKAKAYFLVQLCAYADMIAAIQGVRPRLVHVVNGERVALPFRTDDYWFHYRSVRDAFLALQRSFAPDGPRPVPHPRANHGRWQSHADAVLDAADHPVRVAGITGGQLKKLAAAGITTLEELATTPLEHVAKIDDAAFARLRAQARLQRASAGKKTPLHELAPAGPTGGLALLPPASKLDVYFDMEGYPLVEGGLEYLFGATVLERGKPRFHGWWAHDTAEEKVAFEAFIDWAVDRHRRDRGMHIYHYAPYEVTAMRRLAGKYGTREDEVDELLRHEVFVDLYRIVRQGIRVGEPRYSLKNVEHLYRGAREGDVSNAGDSIVEYARWIETQDPAILEAIRKYNEDDCNSTWELAVWLRARQAEANIAFAGGESTADEEREVHEADALAEAMLANAAIPEQDRAVNELLTFLLGFHRREDKPVWWNLFDKQKCTEAELLEDAECLAGCVRTSRAPFAMKRSLAYEYAFDPSQETKVVDRARRVADLKQLEIQDLDRVKGRFLLKVGAKNEPPPDAMSLMPDAIFTSKPLRDSIHRTVTAWCERGKLPRAVDDLLRRRAPRIAGLRAGAPLLAAGEDLTEGTIRVLRGMRDTTLAIQGPPGAGKTTVASRAIQALIADGKRVGVASNSHKAVLHLMEATLARGRVAAAKIGEMTARLEQLGAEQVPTIASTDALLVGGTAWAFAREDAAGTLDYLFVDEAGQVSLANLVAMAPSARNLVLLGDQMQLSQPTKGSHPGESGSSSLDYLLAGQTTVHADRGIFLARSWRMHPALCRFVSGAFYEDRLEHEPRTERRTVTVAGLPPAGLHFVPVPHEDNTQSSEEEATEIASLVRRLVGATLVDGDVTRKLTKSDILVVSPYNQQVRLLESRLPGMRIGSVDRFQGQEAAVVIVSMASSRADGSARGIEFVLDPNRINVAISRAQCLAIVVGSPELAAGRVTSVAAVKLANLYCRIMAESAAAPPSARGGRGSVVPRSTPAVT